jgi:hypothetical protein
VGNRLTGILGSTLQDQSLGTVEVCSGTNLADRLAVNTLEGGLLGVKSLGGSYIELLLFSFVALVEMKRKGRDERIVIMNKNACVYKLHILHETVANSALYQHQSICISLSFIDILSPSL